MKNDPATRNASDGQNHSFAAKLRLPGVICRNHATEGVEGKVLESEHRATSLRALALRDKNETESLWQMGL